MDSESATTQPLPHHPQQPPPHQQPPPPQQQHQPPRPQQQVMMMAPPPLNSYDPQIPNTQNNGNNNNNNNGNNTDHIDSSISTTPMQQEQKFPFNPQPPKPLESSNSLFTDANSPSIEFGAGRISNETGKKKRGRPRKYSGDGNISLGLSPSNVTPLSVVAPSGGGTTTATPRLESSLKKSRGRPPGPGKKQPDAIGSFGVGFTPHIITIKAGEDVASKIMAFSQQGQRTVSILSASGAISNVTLHHPAISGGFVSYEGRFEIISLSGSLLTSESNGICSQTTGGLSVSLSGTDGQVFGGRVASLLVAATPVQLIVGSFIEPKSGLSPAPLPNMLNFGAQVPGASPSEGGSSESSDESGSSPLNQGTGSYGYANMGWTNSTTDRLSN